MLGFFIFFFKALLIMTEKEFIEKFGEHEEHYIKIKDLKKILVEEELVYDFMISKKDEIWEGREHTIGTILRAFGDVFGKGWEDKLKFPELTRDFKKLTYRKGLGIIALRYITKMCKLSGHKLTAEMCKFDQY